MNVDFASPPSGTSSGTPSGAGSGASAKYEQLEEVGHGGMAVVYRGRDRVLDREVAIKVLHPHLADRLESRQRLHREALTVAKLRHPNIVEIYDYSSPEQGSSFIVTEFIHGKTLRWWLDGDWKPRPVLAVLIALRLAEALAHAHELGVVHRDIKPENVMIRRDGCVKLMDFGIAHFLDHQKLTMTGQLLGSPAYMAPELIDGQPVDERADVFSLAVLLYQLATGELPFNGRNPHEVLRKIASADYPPAKSINPRVDDELEGILAKALAREVGDRYSSAQQFADAMTAYLKGIDIDGQGPELTQYFEEGEDFAQSLEARLCDTLVAGAAKAQRNGQHAKALNEVGRALEIRAQHPAALDLLQKIQARGQRMRTILGITAAIGVLGIAAAGVLLMRQPTSNASPLRWGPDTSSLSSQAKNNEVKAPTEAADRDRTDKKPPKPLFVIDSPTADSPSPESQAQNQPTAEFKAKAEPESDSGATPAIPTEATKSPTNADSKAPGPELPEASKVQTKAADSKPQKTKSALQKRHKRGTETGESSEKRPTESTACRILVHQIPVPARPHYLLFDTQNNIGYRLPRSGHLPVEFPLAGGTTTLELRAAAKGGQQSYEGRLRVRKEQCGPKRSPLHLHAKALPALLKFRALNFRLEDLVVQCIRNCGGDRHRKRMATAFSRIQLPADALEQRVRFRFWVEGYKKLEKTFRLRPGYNELPIRLEALNGATKAK